MGRIDGYMYQLLIVEDEQSIGDGLAYLFPWKELRFEVAGVFDSGIQALAFAQAHPVDAVLTDIMMPQMNGIDLAHELRRLYPEVEIVFLTGYRDFSFAHEAIQLHVSNYLLKPVKYEELVSTFVEIRDRLDSVHMSQNGNDQIGYSRKLMRQVQDIVNANLRSITLESASVSVNLSSGYLSRLFKECVGISFSDYCNQARMRRAAFLLLQTDMRTYEISDEVGYDNPKNFTRAFHKYYGVSPRDYRNGGCKGGENE